MNINSLSKASFIAVAIVIAGGAVKPQKAFGGQTGTLPVIIGPSSKSLITKTKDNGSIPIIIAPNPANVNGDGSGSHYGGGDSYTITITLNNTTSTDQPLSLSSNHPELVQVPDNATVSAGSSVVTTTFTVPYSFAKHHKRVKLYATCNNNTVECTVNVHYQGEQD